MNSVTLHCSETLGISYPETLIHLPVPKGLYSAPHFSVSVDGVSVPCTNTADHTLCFPLSLTSYATRSITITPLENVSGKVSAGNLLRTSSKGIELFPPALGSDSSVDPVFLLPPAGRHTFRTPVRSADIPAPIRAIRSGSGIMLARGFLDTASTRVTGYSVCIEHRSPIFARVSIRYNFETGETYSFQISVASCEPFVRIHDETSRPSSLFRARQILVMDAQPASSGTGICDLADHTLFLSSRPCNAFCDSLVARLYPWTQGSQIAQLREGFQYTPPESPYTLAWFVTDPNSWTGFKHSFIDFYERQLPQNDVFRRGGEDHAETYAYLPPDLQARGVRSGFQPVVSAEAILAGDSRSYAIGVGAAASLRPPKPLPPHTLEWYEGPAHLAEWSEARLPLRAIINSYGLAPIRPFIDRPLPAPEWGPVRRVSIPVPPAGALTSASLALEQSFPPDIQRLLPCNTPESARRLLEYIRDKLDVLASGYVAARGPGGTNPVTLRPVFPAAIVFRDLLAKKLVPDHLDGEDTSTPPLAQRLYSQFVFLAELCSRPAFYPGERTMLPFSDPDSSEPTCLGMPNMNFFTDVYCLCGGLSFVFSNHPSARRWRNRANAMLRRQLEVFSDSRSGIWEESHTYYHHVLRTLAIFALEQQAYATAGISHCIDWFQDPEFKRLCAVALRLVTPRDTCRDNLRMLPTLGDHRAELHWHTYATLAVGFAPHDPALAAALSWFSRENGWTGNTPIPPSSRFPVTFAPAGCTILDGLGALIRNFTTTPDDNHETLLILRSGYSWGHHNCDELECLYWVDNDPIITEAGYGMPKTFEKVGQTGHSTLQPLHFQPAFYLSRATRGHITKADAAPDGSSAELSAKRIVAFQLPAAAESAMLVPVRPYTQTRTLRFTRRDQHSFELLVVDSHSSNEPHRLIWHTACPHISSIAPGTLLLRSGRTETRLETTPLLDFSIQADASGYTTALIAEIPPDVTTIQTRFFTRLIPFTPTS